MALWNLKVYGIVQGVGFRPFVSRLADRFGILGSVSNKGPYVEIFAKGDEAALGEFRNEIAHHPPVRAVVLKLDTEYLKEDCSFSSFDIIESAREHGEIFVSPDIATCDQCRNRVIPSVLPRVSCRRGAIIRRRGIILNSKTSRFT